MNDQIRRQAHCRDSSLGSSVSRRGQAAPSSADEAAIVRRRVVLAGFAAAGTMTLSGCASIKAVTGKIGSFASGLFGGSKPQAPAWRNVVVSASRDANQNSPVALDIVFVKDAALSEALLSSPASKWFGTRGDLRRSFPDALTTISLEIVPGQSIMLDSTHLQGHVAHTVLAFAHYPGAGDHRERMSLSAAGYMIELGGRGFRTAEVGKR